MTNDFFHSIYLFFLSTKKLILDRNKTKRFQYFLIHSLVSFFHDFFFITRNYL